MVVPANIRPRLVQVQSDSRDELLFRYACLHWSIPISSGYGRRVRFLVIDESNNKLIGVIGIGDPVYSLAARDKWIGWNEAEHRERLHAVMDAFVLGAVPPYAQHLSKWSGELDRLQSDRSWRPDSATGHGAWLPCQG
jgi:hypothetical protein